MAGHSKWANIKHRKGAQDAKRSKIFTRIIKEITIATKEGGDDIDSNPRLRLAISNAKGANMPKSNIEKAISKGKDRDTANFIDCTYEGYAPHGVAVFVECTTDNLNRTVSEVRAAFNKNNGTLGTNGSLSFIFDRKGIFVVKSNDKIDEDEITLELIDSGAEDFDFSENNIIIQCSIENFGSVQKKIEETSLEIENAQLERIPNITKELDQDKKEQVLKLVNKLEELEDVSNVFHNLQF